MTGKNEYFIRSHISEKKFREIIKLFSVDLTAQQISLLSGVSRNSINKILNYLHLKECEFRFNHRHDNLYLLLLKIIRNKPLKLS